MTKGRVVYAVPHTVFLMVKSICGDYERRRLILRRGEASPEVAEELQRLIDVIDEALTIVEDGIRMEMLRDIIYCRGYDSSMASPLLSKNAYYNRKRRIVHDVAIALHLM